MSPWSGSHILSSGAAEGAGATLQRTVRRSVLGSATPGGSLPGQAPTDPLHPRAPHSQAGQHWQGVTGQIVKTHQIHCKKHSTPTPRVPCWPPAGKHPSTLGTNPAHAHARHTLSRLLCGWPSEAEFDVQEEVNHVLFITNGANIARITSPQTSPNKLKANRGRSPPSTFLWNIPLRVR